MIGWASSRSTSIPTADGVLFGSEPKAILANPLAKRIVDTRRPPRDDAFVKTPGHAMWKGMQEVEPGTIVTVDERSVRTRTYWRLRVEGAHRRPGHLGRPRTGAARATSSAASSSPTSRDACCCQAD